MNIVLCGFMGCGKTTIGKMLRKMTSYNFVDLDREIEEFQKKKISEIFAELGEQGFRQIESDVLKNILSKDNYIIATGGGAVINPINVELINNSHNSTLVYIDVPVNALKERLKNDKKRPLLQRDDRADFIEKLYNQRTPIYKNVANFVVDGAAPAIVVAKRIKKIIILDK